MATRYPPHLTDCRVSSELLHDMARGERAYYWWKEASHGWQASADIDSAGRQYESTLLLNPLSSPLRIR